MSAEKRFAYERLIAQNAAAVHGEKKKIEEVKSKAVKKLLLRGKAGKATVEEIAEDCEVPISFVLDIQNHLAD